MKCGEESITPAGLKRSVRQWRFPSPASTPEAVPSSQAVQAQLGTKGAEWGSATGSASSSGGGGVGGGSGSAVGESAKTGAGQGSGDAPQRGSGASGGGANQASGASSEGADKHESGDGGGSEPSVDGGGEDGGEGVTVRVSHVDAHRLLCCVGLNEEYFDLVDVDRCDAGEGSYSLSRAEAGLRCSWVAYRQGADGLLPFLPHRSKADGSPYFKPPPVTPSPSTPPLTALAPRPRSWARPWRRYGTAACCTSPVLTASALQGTGRSARWLPTVPTSGTAQGSEGAGGRKIVIGEGQLRKLVYCQGTDRSVRWLPTAPTSGMG